MNLYSGYCCVVQGSSIVYGDVSASFVGASVTPGNLFRLNYQKAPCYTIATVYSATRIGLTSKYVTASQQGYPFVISRSFSTYRNYTDITQGDSCFPDIFREQVVDKIDNDLCKYHGGTASLLGIKCVTSDKYANWSVAASGVLEYRVSGALLAHVATVTGSWIYSITNYTSETWGVPLGFAIVTASTTATKIPSDIRVPVTGTWAGIESDMAFVSVEGNDIRFRYEGVTASKSFSHKIFDGEYVIIRGADAVRNFSFRTVSSIASVFITTNYTQG